MMSWGSSEPEPQPQKSAEGNADVAVELPTGGPVGVTLGGVGGTAAPLYEIKQEQKSSCAEKSIMAKFMPSILEVTTLDSQW